MFHLYTVAQLIYWRELPYMNSQLLIVRKKLYFYHAVYHFESLEQYLSNKEKKCLKFERCGIVDSFLQCSDQVNTAIYGYRIL